MWRHRYYHLPLKDCPSPINCAAREFCTLSAFASTIPVGVSVSVSANHIGDVNDMVSARLAAIAQEFREALPSQDGQILAAMIENGVTVLGSHIRYAFVEEIGSTREAASSTAEELATIFEGFTKSSHVLADGTPVHIAAARELRRLSASEGADRFCWLVELFLPEGNSLGLYHTGFTDLSGGSRSTQDPHKAKRYSKAQAETAAEKLGHTLSGVWRAIEHGFQSMRGQSEAAVEPENGHAGEDWELLAMALAREDHDDIHQLIWEGGPIPEPWGEVWQKYEDDARRMIALVREHAPAPEADVGPNTGPIYKALMDALIALNIVNQHPGSASGFSVRAAAQIDAILNARPSTPPEGENQ